MSLKKLYQKVNTPTSPLLLFFPLLLMYLLLLMLLANNTLEGDEGRYFAYAQNLLKGQYALTDGIFLWNGPGYPLFLVPFLYLNIPIWGITFVNAFLHYFSICLFYKSTRLYVEHHRAILFAYILGLYWMPFKTIASLLTEPLFFFLISLFTYAVCKYFHLQQQQKPSTLGFVGLSILLAYIILTKVIFAYIVPCLIIVLLLLYIFLKKEFILKSIYICSLAIFLCTPYLYYTYTLTGQWYYWGNSGGMSLYWMSNPHPEEYGDWQNETFTTAKGVAGAQEKFQANHQQFFNQIATLDPIAKDEAFKEKAFQNIYNQPIKYFKNWLCNIGRLFFNYPFSYYPHSLSTFGNILPNMFIAVFMLLFSIPTILQFWRLPFAIQFLLLFCFIYLFVSSLVSCYPRMLYVVAPIIFLWLFYIMDKLFIIKRL